MLHISNYFQIPRSKLRRHTVRVPSPNIHTSNVPLAMTSQKNPQSTRTHDHGAQIIGQKFIIQISHLNVICHLSTILDYIYGSVICHTSSVNCRTSCQLSYVICQLSYVICQLSAVCACAGGWEAGRLLQNRSSPSTHFIPSNTRSANS